MNERKEYEMTQEDLNKILEACKPTSGKCGSCSMEFLSSPQENSDRAWAQLGKRFGFDFMTVQPIPGKGQRYFSAVPIPEPKGEDLTQYDLKDLESKMRELKEIKVNEDSKIESENKNVTLK